MPKGTYTRTLEIREMASKKRREFFAKGGVHPLLGKRHSQITKERMSLAKMGKFAGKNSPWWTGDNPTYNAVHIWMRKEFGTPDTCEHCGRSGLQGRLINWANVSGKYKRDRTDWLRLCASCHKKYDLQKKYELAI